LVIYRKLARDFRDSKKRALLTIATEPPDDAWHTPMQQELDGLFGELKAFNERIAELAKEGHKSLAINVLKAQALSLASQIDELRGILVVSRRSPKMPKSRF